MAALSEVRNIIQVEEVAYRAAVSESTLTRVGETSNFILVRQHDTKQFFINGTYSKNSGLPQIGVDGAIPILFNITLIDVCMFNLVAGSSGQTEIDVKRVVNSGGSGTTIFSTKPRIASTAGNNAYVGTAAAGSFPGGTGLTQPVLSVTDLDAGDLLFCELTDAQVDGENTGVVIFFRPR